MGLSIHYSGAFKKGESLSSMIEEIIDIAKVYNWQYFVFNDTFDDESFGDLKYNGDVYGISFTPPECETIWLSFLSNGKMSSAMHLEIYGEDEERQDYLYMLSVKTQYAGIEIHKLIIHLLRYISQKYFSNFKLTDEGQYWETGDEALLKEIFSRYDGLINSFSSALEIYPKTKGESFDDYFIRLLNQIQKRGGKSAQ